MNWIKLFIHLILSLFRKPSEVAGSAVGKSWIVLHHWFGEPKTREEAWEIALREGYSDIPYNYIITKAGEIWKGRPESSCAANLGINSRAVAICFLGNFEVEDPTIPQLMACARLIRELLKRHPAAKLILHRDVFKLVPRALYKGRLVSTATACPGKRFVNGRYGAILWKMACGLTFEQARKKVYDVA